MREKVIIVGGGMTGLIAQRYIPDALILDWGPAPTAPATPKQWGAIYWWEPIADIACEAFQVLTTIDGKPATGDGILKYKRRVGKAVEVTTRPDAINRQFQTHSTGYRPLVFPPPTRIAYRAHVVAVDIQRQQVMLRDGTTYGYEHLISTIPLYALQDMVTGSDDIMLTGFRHAPIFVYEERHAVKPPSRMHVDYTTTGDAYRVTTHLDGSIHREATSAVWLTSESQGINVKRIVPGRIHDLPGTVELVERFADVNVHCFGRYARWDSDELLHHTAHDIGQWAAQAGLSALS